MNRREAVIAGLASLATAVGVQTDANAQTPDTEAANPELDPLRTLLAAYDKAFANQDLDGVMATLSEKAAIMGTGPGEVWSGADEIKAAYRHFFEGFDVGEQSFDYEFSMGQVAANSGWMLTSGNVNGKKGGEDFSFPVNVSLTASKDGGKWLISTMHFSTFTDLTTDES